MESFLIWTRRSFLERSSLAMAGAAGVALIPPHLFAEELLKTPTDAEGPFYPDELPLDTDNDLIIINENLDQAVGEVTHLHGKITDTKGNPIKNAKIEIWQVDNNSRYIHTRDQAERKRDGNFQGFGRFVTGMDGTYYFRTIKPPAYPGRAPHIHFKVYVKNKCVLTSQFYVKGAAANKTDGLLKRIKDPKQRALAILDFKPIPDSKIGELSAIGNVVI